MTDLLKSRVDPLECSEGCYPPIKPMLGRDADNNRIEMRANQTWDYLDGDRWVCDHGTAYEAYDPSNDHWCYTFRKWRKLGGRDARRARVEAGIEPEPTGRLSSWVVLVASMGWVWLATVWGAMKEMLAVWLCIGAIILIGIELMS